MRVLSAAPEETLKIGERLGLMLMAGQTVCLYGDLGAGKTIFTKGIARGMGIPEEEITSASYLIVAEHESTPPLYHIDLYRLDNKTDLDEIGLYEYIGGDGIAVIEWAEKADLRDVQTVDVTITLVSEHEREIIIEGVDENNWHNM